MKKAYKADLIYYDGKLFKDKFLIFDEKIIGISDDSQGAEEVFEKKNSFIMPAFINTHTHLPMSFFRGLADDIPLMDWLKNHIWPAESKFLDEDFVYDATLLAACEMIHSGTVWANDMYFFSRSIGEAIKKAGLKAVLGAGILDFPTKFGSNLDDYLQNALKLYEYFKGERDIKIALSPHAPYTVSPESYKKCISFAEKYDFIIHTHLAETVDEVKTIAEKYGKTPVMLMDEIGLFDTRSIVAHMVHLTDEEIEIVGKKSVNIAHCLESNLKLGSGFAPIKKYMDKGANISIGTDGAASNNDLDMLGEISAVAKFHKGLNLDPTVLDAETVINMATKNAAKGLYIDGCGELKAGFYADFTVFTFQNCWTVPLFNPISQVVYSAKSENITDLFVNGNAVMLDKKITTFDEDEVIDKGMWWGKKIR